MNMTLRNLRAALLLFVLLSAVAGVLYPLAVTGIAGAAFPSQAHGSLIVRNGQAVGSRLIGQEFTSPRYFQGRPSATSPMPYNALGSGGSNLGPLNPALASAVKSRIDALRAADPAQTQPPPADLVTASGSGLDPHISVGAARWQAARVARERGWPKAEVDTLIERHTEQPLLGLLGTARVNVLELNLALDEARINSTGKGRPQRQNAP